MTQILADHEKWVQSKGKEGSEANLAGVDLQGVDLANLNLQGANLTEAQLQRAILRGTVLQDAEMQGADLIGARDLLAGQLAGANLCRAKLPEDIKFPELASVDEASRSAQTLLFSMLLACIYSWITIATTIDARLLTNSATSPLPILGSAIPIVWFYIAAPVVLFVVYVYFHLHLQGVWEGLGRLPAVFPDGQPLDRRVYLWFLSSFVRKYSVRLRDVPDDRSFLLGLLEVGFGPSHLVGCSAHTGFLLGEISGRTRRVGDIDTRRLAGGVDTSGDRIPKSYSHPAFPEAHAPPCYEGLEVGTGDHRDLSPLSFLLWRD